METLMNKARLGVLAAALLAAGVAAAGGGPGHRGPDMDRMAILLDLNDSQKVEVQKVLEEQREKMQTVREQHRASGTRPSPEDRQKMRETMRQETVTKLQEVLTPEQIKKFEALTDRPMHHRDGMRDRKDD